MSSNSTSLGIVVGASLGPSFNKTFGTISSKQKALGDSLKRSRIGASVSGDLLKYSKQLDDLKRKQALGGNSSVALAKKIRVAETQFKRAQDRASKYGIEIGSAARQHKRFERSALDAERALGRLQKRERNRGVRKGLLGETAGVMGAAYALSRPFAKSMERETAVVRLGTVINSEDTEASILAAQAHARNFSKKNIGTEVELLNIQYALNSAGLEADAARLGSAIVSKVATVTNGASEQVGEVIATVFNNLGGDLEGTTQERLTRIGELLTKTQFKFQIRDFSQLGESMKMAAPILSQYNIELSQGLTLLGALNSAGLQGTTAGTALTATISNLSKASKELGFELIRNEKGQLDFIATMESMSDAIGGLDNMDQDVIDDMKRLFGDEGIRGITLLGEKLQKLKQDQLDVAESSRGIVDDSYQKFLDSTPGKISVLSNNLVMLGNTFISAFIPAINQALPPLIGLVDQVGSFISANPEVGMAILGLTAGLVGLKAASIVGRLGVSLISDGVALFGGTLSLVKKGVFLFGAALPIVKKEMVLFGDALGFLGKFAKRHPVIAVLTAIAGAAMLLIDNWGPIKEFFKPITNMFLGFWEPIKLVWDQAWGWVSGYFGKFDSIIGKIKSIWPFGSEASTQLGVTVSDNVVPFPAAKNSSGSSLGGKPAEIIPLDDSRSSKKSAGSVTFTIGDINVYASTDANAEEIAVQVRQQFEALVAQYSSDLELSVNG